MTEEQQKKSVKVVVLGDIGRSPRMQYHALSLSDNGFKVNIIAYTDSASLTEVLQNSNITITKLHSYEFDKGPKILQLFLKAFWQAISLFITLLITGKCDYLLCQNPPSVPTLPVCRFYCLVTKSKFIIDWHNYGHTIMALSKSPSLKILLKIYTFIERYFGQSAQHNLCVTYAMKEDLLENWNINATVLYDRPPNIFYPITLLEKHDFFVKLAQKYPEFFGPNRVAHSGDGSNTAFTHVVDEEVKLLQDRPGILFSSTSWTPDEDFGILMDALQVYETTFELAKKLPELICVITGKGPMKQHYIDLIASRNWQHVKVITPWLDASDYPTMVASADLGVCLHTSSSGLDLPMKVVDMFGAGLPVCAYSFRCLEELVQDGINGYVFKTSDELSKLIVSWFEEFPQTSNETAIKPELSEVKIETNISSLTDPDDEYHCEYRDDIWKNLLEQESQKPIIHLQSPQLEYRGALVQQLRDVTKKLELSLATLHSAVAQLDLFMDAHRLRSDRLTHVALACLSLAAKSEEKFSRAPTLKTLSKISGVQLCGKTFRQLEWMVGQHVRWRLLAPTPVTFAALLTQYVVTDSDLTTRHPKFVRRFKRDGAKLLEAYLDLTLSDVRLKVVESVDVGCACVACARADLGLCAWPGWLATVTGRKATSVAPIARLLQRMMQIMKSREGNGDSEIDQGYSSARTSPNLTPCHSPTYQVSPASSSCSTSSYINVEAYRQRPVTERRLENAYSVLDLSDTNPTPTVNVQDYYRLPTAIDMTCQRVNNPADYRFCRSSRLIEASLDSVQPSNVAVKRGLDTNVELERKRYRLASQMSQVVL